MTPPHRDFRPSGVRLSPPAGGSRLSVTLPRVRGMFPLTIPLFDPRAILQNKIPGTRPETLFGAGNGERSNLGLNLRRTSSIRICPNSVCSYLSYSLFSRTSSYDSGTSILCLHASSQKPDARSGLRLERETGIEPATSSLARKRSTTELFPQRYVREYSMNLSLLPRDMLGVRRYRFTLS